MSFEFDQSRLHLLQFSKSMSRLQNHLKIRLWSIRLCLLSRERILSELDYSNIKFPSSMQLCYFGLPLVPLSDLMHPLQPRLKLSTLKFYVHCSPRVLSRQRGHTDSMQNSGLLHLLKRKYLQLMLCKKQFYNGTQFINVLMSYLKLCMVISVIVRYDEESVATL